MSYSCLNFQLFSALRVIYNSLSINVTEIMQLLWINQHVCAGGWRLRPLNLQAQQRSLF